LDLGTFRADNLFLGAGIVKDLNLMAGGETLLEHNADIRLDQNVDRVAGDKVKDQKRFHLPTLRRMASQGLGDHMAQVAPGSRVCLKCLVCLLSQT
jgi:hypothetical protein